MKTRCIPVGPIGTNCYIVDGEGFLMVIDPGAEPDTILDGIGQRSVTHIVLTHAHFDHIGALGALCSCFPAAKLCYNSAERTSAEEIAFCANLCGMECDAEVGPADEDLQEGSTICGFSVLHTPGHTPGSICLLNREEKVMFSGDTLFFHGFGRTDLGGSKRDMVASMHRLLAMDADITVFPGHGEATTIGSEKEHYHVV